VILCGNGRPNVPRIGISLWSDRDAFARDLSRCWAMCVEKLRAMHWWAQLRGLREVVVSAAGTK
jgi:hypothetical protein